MHVKLGVRARAARQWSLVTAAAGFALALLGGQAFAGEDLRSPVAPAALGSKTPGLSADFLKEAPSQDTRQIADWITRTGDNQNLPFIIVDKKAAWVFVFDSRARLMGATRALLGRAVGDDSAPGIGDRPLSKISPEDRTTPSGRFVASLGHNIANQETLWVDYDTALALHPVRSPNSPQGRTERLSAQSPFSRRITFGCINVSGNFYEHVVRPDFVGSAGIVYILPETKTIDEVFFGAVASD